MEELHPHLADRRGLSLINRKQIRKEDFVLTENDVALVTDEARKTLLNAWKNAIRKKSCILTHRGQGIDFVPSVEISEIIELILYPCRI